MCVCVCSVFLLICYFVTSSACVCVYLLQQKVHSTSAFYVLYICYFFFFKRKFYNSICQITHQSRWPTKANRMLCCCCCFCSFAGFAAFCCFCNALEIFIYLYTKPRGVLHWLIVYLLCFTRERPPPTVEPNHNHQMRLRNNERAAKKHMLFSFNLGPVMPIWHLFGQICPFKRRQELEEISGAQHAKQTIGGVFTFFKVNKRWRIYVSQGCQKCTTSVTANDALHSVKWRAASI